MQPGVEVPKDARPPKATCQYCGRPLVPIAFSVSGGQVIFDWYCDCEAARQARNLAREKRMKSDLDSVLAKNIRAEISKSGIPIRFQSASAPRLPERGAYLFGPVGSGKTYWACADGLFAIREGKKVIFTTLAEILTKVKSTFGKSSNLSERDVLIPYISCDLLIIDDLGRGQITEWGIEHLFQLVDARWRDGRRMVVTSNYERDELGEMMSAAGDRRKVQAILSRLFELPKIAVSGGDRRCLPPRQRMSLSSTVKAEHSIHV